MPFGLRVSFMYIKPTSGTEPVQQSVFIILSTIKVKSEGRRFLASSLLQNKEEQLKEGKSFNSQCLTLSAPPGELC